MLAVINFLLPRSDIDLASYDWLIQLNIKYLHGDVYVCTVRSLCFVVLIGTFTMGRILCDACMTVSALN